MKNRKISIAACVMAIGLVAALVLAGMTSAETGLVGEWHFDGNAQDSSGNGFHGIINGAAFVQGISGQALSFNGVDDYVQSNVNINTLPLTMEAWVYPRSITGTGNNNKYIIDNDAGDNAHAIGIDNSRFMMVYHDGGLLSSVTLSTNTWYHVTGVWEQGTVKLYINGLFDGTATFSQGSLNGATSDTTIGKYRWGQPFPRVFDGIIDEVKIYNRALSAEEIREHYELGIAVPATVDIKPDTLNKASKSNNNAVTVYIEIPGYDVNAIDVSTITMSTEKGEVSAQFSPTEVGDYDNDDVPDRMVKLNRQAVLEIVDVGEVNITIRGSVADVIFKGNDVINVID